MKFRSAIAAPALLLYLAVLGYAADAPISLELVTDRGFPIDGQQRWMRFLQDREFGLTHVRIRTAQAGDEPKIVNRGSESAPRYAVTGALTANSRLLMPGLVLRYGQRTELIAWLKKLRRGGEDAATAPTVVFGLTAKQLTTLHEALKNRVAITTKDKSLRDVLQHLERNILVKVEFDSQAQRLLRGNNNVLDELQGLSCGTALAAAVRPYGLLVTPSGQGTRTVGVRVTGSAKLEDAWPVGTRAKSGLMKLAPVLAKFITVEIVDEPLDDALDVIQDRLEIPFLYDHNALARHEVDLHEPVNLPRKKTFYKKILDRLLFQKMLVCELRTDEAGAPFLWITSAKR